MTPDSPNSSREELEARLTALLLGELPEDEAAALRQTIAQDADLARLHDRLQLAIALVRETVAEPETETAAITDVPKLAAERREKLLASFKTGRPKDIQQSRRRGVNWAQVKWREFAALAAMLVGLLAVGGMMMGREGGPFRSFRMMTHRSTTDGGYFDTASRAWYRAEASLPRSHAKAIAGASGPEPGSAPPNRSIRLSENAPSDRNGVAMDGLLNGSSFTASLYGGPSGPPVNPTVAVPPPPALAPVHSPAPEVEVRRSLERSPRQLAGIALPTLGDVAQSDSDGVGNGREKEQLAGPSQNVPSDFFQSVSRGDFGGARNSLAGGERRAGGMGGGGAGMPGRDVSQSIGAGNEPVSGRSADKQLPSQPAGNATPINAWAVSTSDSGLVANDIGGPVSLAAPMPSTPTPDSPPKNDGPRFGNLDRNGTLEKKGGVAGAAIDETTAVELTGITTFLSSTKRALQTPMPVGGGLGGTPPAVVAAAKPAAIEDSVQLQVASGTNMIVDFAIAGMAITPTPTDGWAGVVPQDGRATFYTFGAQPTPTPTPQSSFRSGLLLDQDRAVRGRDLATTSAGGTGDPSALGVFSHEAVGYVNLDANKGIAPGTKPDTDSDSANRFSRLRRNGATVTDAKDAPVEAKKLAELSKGPESAGVTSAWGARPMDAEVDQSGSKSKRESARALGERPQLAQQLFDDEAKLRKSRIDIALPAGERSEVGDRFQVATGPVVANEINISDPSTGLPGPTISTKANAVQSTKGTDELRQKLASIRLSELKSDGLPLGQVIEELNRKIKESDPDKKGINLVVDNTADPPAPPPAAIEPATGLPNTTATVDDIAAVTIDIARPLRDVTVGQALDMISKSADRPIKLSLDPNGVVISAAVDSSKESRELENLKTVRDRLQTRIMQEKVDISAPKSGIVEIIDRAEAQPEKKPTLWQRVRGAVTGEIERSTRIAVEKDASDVAGLDGQRASMAFDPYWQQTQLEKIQSKEVLGKVIEKLDLDEAWAGKEGGGKQLKPEETYRLLRRRLTVGTDPKSGLIDIRVKSDNANDAARIANTIAETYLTTRDALWKERSRLGLQILSTELANNEKQIAEARQELNRRKTEPASKEADAALPKLAAGAAVPQPEVTTTENAFSTFSLNVSDVSFKLAAASLEKGRMPEPATVRSEEFINAFDYRDPDPKGSAPIAFTWERARYPFAHDRDLVRFSVKTAASGRQPGRPLNLVLLLDNSGSMERADRVRIIQECLRVLAGQLQAQDRVSVVAFARTARLWVDGLPGNQAGELPQRVGGLTPQGGTNLEDAMNLAYQTALRHYLAQGVNRVVLLTDGAANLGDVQPESLKKKVETHRQQGIALDCFGIGWEGFNDELLETLSRNGDGRYGFVNTPEAATSEFAGQLAGALKVAASDVKVQVEFNPRRATAYRQIGYAKHQLKKEQFRDNTVDAAEIGAAEAGNALYVVQVNPAGEGPIGTVRVRFKVPGTSDYREHEWPVPYEGAARSMEQSSAALRLAASASAFSEWLVSSPYAGEVTPDKLLGYLNGVPETWPADPRPKKLEWMIRQAKSVAGK